MIFIDHNLPALERVSTPNGRFYKTPDGNLYPSVTTILGSLSAHYINEWKEKVGEVEATRISKAAATRGTELHTNCENYLLGNPVVISPFDWNGKTMFKNMVPELDKIQEIHALESMLYSDRFKFAGTVDCVGKIDDVMYIIDFKTSKNFKYAKDIESYYIQTTMYAIAFYERTGIPIKKLRILITTENDGVLVYDEDVKNWVNKFVQLRNSVKI